MIANQTLLQMKYARIISAFAKEAKIPVAQAMDFFYHSTEYRLMREGVGDLHCMTDEYIVDDLKMEYQNQGRYDKQKTDSSSFHLEDCWHEGSDQNLIETGRR